MNILITSAGRRVSLVKFFQTELRLLYPEGKVFTVDMNPKLSPACNISDRFFKVPKVTDKSYIEILLGICINNKIKIIIPTIDTELLVLATNRKYFQEHGIEIVISDPDLIFKCSNKRLIHDFFNIHGIQHAHEIDRTDLKFPLFIKPVKGSASINTYLVKDKPMLSDYILNNEGFMFLEYLSPDDYDEFTVDLYYDKRYSLKCVVPRKRLEIRAGEVSKGLTIKNEIVQFVWKKLDRIKGFRGCITLQVFLNKGSKEIIGNEINPRFGGGYPLSYLAGANFPKWIIQEYLLNEEINQFNNWEDNLLMLRYDDEILVHGYKIR